MAIAKIKEHTDLRNSSAYPMQVWTEPAHVEQTPVTYTGTSAQSAAFSTQTKYITIQADAAACFLVGTNPTATANSFAIPADYLLTFAVQPGHKIAFFDPS